MAPALLAESPRARILSRVFSGVALSMITKHQRNMFHLSDLQPTRSLVYKTPENPFESIRAFVRVAEPLQGMQSQVYISSISGIGDVLIKEMKPAHHPQQGLDAVVELEVALKRDGAPVAELLSYHEWNDNMTLKNALVYRYYPGGDLFQHILRLHRNKTINPNQSELIAYSVVKMLCTCLAHLHQKGWVHVDIKPENIFLSHDIESPECLAYLGDFGQAVPVGTMISPWNHGSAVYFPKQDFRFGFQPAQSSVDMYSVGQVLKTFEHIHVLSEHARSVFVALTNREALQRPTAEQMLHQFLPAWQSHLTQANL
jgi:serine/threonine protein kinase